MDERFFLIPGKDIPSRKDKLATQVFDEARLLLDDGMEFEDPPGIKNFSIKYKLLAPKGGGESQGAFLTRVFGSDKVTLMLIERSAYLERRLKRKMVFLKRVASAVHDPELNITLRVEKALITELYSLVFRGRGMPMYLYEEAKGEPGEETDWQDPVVFQAPAGEARKEMLEGFLGLLRYPKERIQ